MSKVSEGLSFVGIVTFLVFLLAMLAGWVMNIVAIVSGNEDMLIRIIRIIGIFVAPVGGVMGWV